MNWKDERFILDKECPLLAERRGKPVRVGRGMLIGSCHNAVGALGPCAVESREQVEEIGRDLFDVFGGALTLDRVIFRAGAFKPRTSPYSWRGLGHEGLRILYDLKERTGISVVTEALSAADLPAIEIVADAIQVGSRNMQNFALLEEIGKTGKPVFLKRSMSATLLEWVNAAEYLLRSGAGGVVFVERGIKHFDPATRNLLDLATVAILAEELRLPVIVDPSHGTGRKPLILPMARAALAAGASGVMIEVHPDPPNALSDKEQAMPLDRLWEIRDLLDGYAKYQPWDLKQKGTDGD